MKHFANYQCFVLPALLLAAGAALAGPPQAVTECETYITEPGKYYLANDLVECEDVGVLILASDVTLDLKGHTVSCADNGARTGGVVAGLYLPVSNVTVRNGGVTGCADGILLAWAENSNITKMTSWDNRLWDGPGSGTGITVWYTENSLITHNVVYGNPNEGIGHWDSSGNLFKHNTAYNNFMGIWSNRADNSEFSCNTAWGNAAGIVLAPQADGNLVRGNLSSYNFYDGISVVGFAWYGFLYEPIPANNTLRKNIAEYNGFVDLFEGGWEFAPDAAEPYVLDPDGTCWNTWQHNQYGFGYAPPGCMGPPMMLHEKDVCALDHDD
jgi:parallel beta-helix repeat protein